MKCVKLLGAESRDKSKPNLICAHHAGGGASFFYPWAKFFSDFNVFALQLPGREELIHQHRANTMGEAIEMVWEAFESHTFEPYILFGHSMGALISFELARKAMNNSTTLPSKLIVSACRAPHKKLSRKPIHKFNDKDFINAIKSYGGLSEALSKNIDELKELYVPVLRSDFEIAENYINDQINIFPFDITVLHGNDDPSVELSSAREWKAYTNGSFVMNSFSGGHFYLNENKNLFLKTLRKTISQ